MSSQSGPNIFEYATSELSQDAFLAWLLKWSSHEARGLDEQLWEMGYAFLKLLFDRHGRVGEVPSEPSVEVFVQKDRIDVLAVVDGHFHLLIEDKVGTKQHSGQLEGYKQVLRDDGIADTQVLPIYLQTHEQSSYAEVEDAGYQIVGREDLLGVLRPYRDRGGSNAIALDFLRYLEGLHKEFTAYETTSVSEEWAGNTWLGFLAETKKRLGRGNYGYVPNASGGFFGLWWNWTPLGPSEREAYIQLENRGDDAKLTWKILCPEKDGRKKARQAAFEAIKAATGGRVEKPSRFGLGKTMTVGVLKGDYRASHANGRIDWDATLKTLEEAEQILQEAVKVL